MKLTFARLAQQISGFEVELLGPTDSPTTTGPWCDRRWSVHRPRRRLPLPARQGQLDRGRDLEILLNILAEKVLGLPPEHRADKDIAWKDLPR